MKGFAFQSLILLLLFCGTESAYAATDGTVGTTSQGDLDIDLSISNLVRISGMADLNFGTVSGTSDAVLDQDVCVWTNVAAGEYKVNAHGDGAANAFTVSNGVGTMAYTVRWNDTVGTSGNVALAAGVLSGVQSNASTTSTTCGGGASANYQVRFTQAVLSSVRPGTYTGVLTVVISP